MEQALNAKVSNGGMDIALEGFTHKVLTYLQAQITADEMKRLAAIQDYSNQLEQLRKNMDLENKVTKQKVNELDQKVKNSLPTKVF